MVRLIVFNICDGCHSECGLFCSQVGGSATMMPLHTHDNLYPCWEGEFTKATPPHANATIQKKCGFINV